MAASNTIKRFLMSAPGSQLAQSRPSGTSAVTLFSAGSTRVEVTRVVVANVTASAATYSLYHDDDGTTYDQGTALAYEVSLPANSWLVLDFEGMGSGITIQAGGAMGIKSGTASAITYTVYGVTQ